MSRHTEADCQRALVRWFEYAHRGLGIPDARLLFAVPNGGRRDAREAALMKAEGIRAGVPDLFLAVPFTRLVPPYRIRHGLFIELKTWQGRVSDSQREMATQLRAQGFEVCLARGFDQATRAIEAYMQGKEIEL